MNDDRSVALHLRRAVEASEIAFRTFVRRATGETTYKLARRVRRAILTHELFPKPFNAGVTYWFRLYSIQLRHGQFTDDRR